MSGYFPCELHQSVFIRTGATFARLVHESLDDPFDRSYTPWTQSRTLLNSWREWHAGWAGHRLVYIERCRLHPRNP